jgi:hypothetical protein
MALLHKNLAGSGMSKAMQDALISRSFGGGRMGTTIEAMYNNIPGLGQKSNQIQSGSTSAKFNADWLATTKTLEFQLKRLDGTVHTLGTSFGNELLPPLTKVVSIFSDLLGWLDKNKGVAMALGTAITGVLVPAMAVYLKGALLKTNGALMTVFRGYGNVISGQSAEQIALGRTNASLAGNDAALAGNDASLAGNDRALLTNTADRAGSGGGLAGGAGGLAAAKSAAMKLGMGALVASMATPIFNQYARKPLTKAIGARGETDVSDALTGAEMGMFLGPEGALAGAGLGALYGERGHLAQDAKNIGHVGNQIGHDFKSGWDDLFGGGATSKSSPAPIHARNIHVSSSLKVAGKPIAVANSNYNKQVAARN